MAVLSHMPNQVIIDGFKGTIDFYLWKGIPVARKWPVWKTRAPYPAEKANQDDFAYANRLWDSLPAEIKEDFKATAQGTHFTGKDMMIRGYMRGLGI